MSYSELCILIVFFLLEPILLINNDEDLDAYKFNLIKAIIEPKLGYKIEYFNSDSTDPTQILKKVKSSIGRLNKIT